MSLRNYNQQQSVNDGSKNKNKTVISIFRQHLGILRNLDKNKNFSSIVSSRSNDLDEYFLKKPLIRKLEDIFHVTCIF